MSNFENSGPAFPSNRDMRYEQEFDREGGMALRQYAAVKMEAAYRVMVDRFLSWKLPQDFGPDAGISFTPPPRLPDLYWPTGTNLFHAGQALEMFKHCVELPSAAAVRLAQKNLFDVQEAAKIIAKQAIAAEAERDALAAKLKEVDGRIDDLLSTCHRLALELECLLLDTKDSASVSRWWDPAMAALDEWHKVKDSVSARPVPAEPVNARLLDVAVWPAGYCRDPNGKMSIPAGKEEDFNFGYDVGFQEAWEILNSAISAEGEEQMTDVTKDLLEALKAAQAYVCGPTAWTQEQEDTLVEAMSKAIARAEAALSAPQPDSSVWVLASAFSPWRSPVACDARHHPRRGSQ